MQAIMRSKHHELKRRQQPCQRINKRTNHPIERTTESNKTKSHFCAFHRLRDRGKQVAAEVKGHPHQSPRRVRLSLSTQRSCQSRLIMRTHWTYPSHPPLPSPPSTSTKEKGLLHDKVVPISQKKRETDRMGGGGGGRIPLGSPTPLSPPTILKGWTSKHKGRLKGYPSIPVTAEDAHRALSRRFHLGRPTSENAARVELISIAQYSVAGDPAKRRMMKRGRVKRKHREGYG